MRFSSVLGSALLALVFICASGGCSTAPSADKQSDYVARSTSTRAWFERHVSGLSAQIDRSAAIIVFPDVAQWGILIGGGSFGRGVVKRPNGSQLGWAALNNASAGLQAGVQGFRMIMVIQDQATLDQFMQGKLTGSMRGIAVAGDGGGSRAQSFTNGVAIYQGANSGLMAGVNIGADMVRFVPTSQG